MLIRPVYRPRLPSLAQGLVGWWPFDDGSCNDFSGNRKHGTPTATYLVGGGGPQIGRQKLARHFDGSTSKISTAPIVSPAMNLSISIWFNAASAPSFNPLYGGTTSPGNHALLFEVGGGNILKFWADELIANAASTTVTVNTGQWYHAVVTQVNQTTTKFYLNGVDVSSTSTTADFATHTENLIGRDTANNFTFDGSLRDVRVYNRVLSPGEVLALYAEAFQPQIDIETIALMRPAAAAGGATPWLYVQNNRPVIGAGTY